MKPVKFTIIGEPAAKANQRRLVMIRGRPAFIKSAKGISYVQAFRMQCPKLNPLMEDDVAVWMRIHYASRRPDMDESLILDAMQGLIYANDRQVKERHTYWALDRARPRTDIVVTTLGADNPL